MQTHYKSLNQKDKRHYAWIEAKKLSYWWKQYIRKLFNCSINTVAVWIKENDSWIDERKWRIRKVWWWDKKRIEKNPNIIIVFDKVIDWYTAWSPVKQEIKRTNLQATEIQEKMKAYWVETTVYVIKQIITNKNMKKRKLFKWETLKSVPWRNEQFENIKSIREEAEKKWNPAISVDTKKKN